MIDQKIKLHCTDKNKTVEGHVLNFKERVFLEVAVNTVKLRLTYNGKIYAGSMAGLEFTVKESDLPKTHQEYRR